MRKKPEKRTNNDNSLRKILYGNALGNATLGKTEDQDQEKPKVSFHVHWI